MALGFTTKIADPASALPGTANGGAVSPDGNWLAVTTDASPYIHVYAISGNTIGAKASNPGTLPAGAAVGVAWSPDGAYLAVAHVASPYITVYPWSGGAFGTKVSNPGTLPAGNGNGVAWNAAGTYLAVAHATTPYITVYPWSGGAFGTKVADPTAGTLTNAGNCVAWSPDDAYLGWSGNSSGTQFVAVWPFTTGFGTVVSNPATMPAGIGRGLAWNGAGTYLAVAHVASPYITVYPWSSGFGTKVANPASLAAGDGRGVVWSDDDAHVVLKHTNTPYLAAWPFTTGFGTKLADPGTLPAGSSTTGTPWILASGGYGQGHATSPYMTIYEGTVSTDVLIQGRQGLVQQWGTQTAVRFGGLLQR